MFSRELQHLLQVLNDRDVPLAREDVSHVFESDENAQPAIAWVKEYLSRDNLLSKDELVFTRKHDFASKSDTQRKAGLRPLTDTDYEAAIMALEASTAAIEEYTRLLEAQKRALEDHQARQRSDHDRQDAVQTQQKRLARQKAQLEFTTSEVVEYLQARLRPQRQHIESNVQSLAGNVDRILEKDDRLLDGLDKLLPRLDGPDPATENNQELNSLCSALITLSEREVRSRIDAAYLNGIESHLATTETNHNDQFKLEKQRDATRSELEELFHEIDGLIHLAVDGRFRNPIQQDLHTASAANERQKAQWSSYVLETLHYLTARLQTIESHGQHLHAHQGALETLGSALEEVLSQSTSTKVNGQNQPTGTAAASVKGLKPLRLVQANFSEPQDPVAQLLRQYDVRAKDINDTSQLSMELQRAVDERRLRLAELSASAERAFVQSLSDTIMNADGHVEHLKSAVYEHSKFGTIKLADGRVQEELARLEDRTHAVGNSMREIDMDGIGREIKAAQKALLD